MPKAECKLMQGTKGKRQKAKDKTKGKRQKTKDKRQKEKGKGNTIGEIRQDIRQVVFCRWQKTKDIRQGQCIKDNGQQAMGNGQ